MLRRLRLLPLVAVVAIAACGSSKQAAPREAPDARPAAAVAASGATVWAVGDGNASQSGRAVAGMIASSNPDRLLYLGDVYPSGTAADFADNYAPSYGRLASRTDPVVGNHDWPNHASGFDPYWQRVLGQSMPAYYRFSIAGWTLLALNSQLEGSARAGQLAWVDRQVRSGGDCRIAYWHRPRFSDGLHGDQIDMDPLWRALAGHARLVLSGHDHDMQEFKPSGGLTQLVAGSGGEGHYAVRSSDPRLVWSDDTDYGALRLTLQPGHATWAFVSESGQTLHTGSVSCSG